MYQLNTPPLKTPIKCLEGKYCNQCTECTYTDICVQHCTESHKGCEQRQCNQECNDCGGGHLRFTGVDIPAVCGKAPLRNLFASQAPRIVSGFKKRSLIELKKHAVIITQGYFGKQFSDPYPKDTELVAVNLRHVWSGNGWYTEDIKDYLRIPEGVKTILLTATHDSVLDRAWDHEVYCDNISKRGFDYWQALDYSQYAYYGYFFNHWQAYRTLTAIKESRAWFAVPFPDCTVISKGKDAYRSFLECAEAIPQLMMHWQCTDLEDKLNWNYAVGTLKRYLRVVPIKSLWFIGVTSPAVVYNLQLNFPTYPCYFLSVNPWIGAQKGAAYTARGWTEKSKASKEELLTQNQLNYSKVVQDAIIKALKEVQYGSSRRDKKSSTDSTKEENAEV